MYIHHTVLTRTQLIFTSSINRNLRWRDSVFCDATDVIENATKKLKSLSKNGFKECFQHFYSRWRNVEFHEGTILLVMKLKWLYSFVFLRCKLIQGILWSYSIHIYTHTHTYIYIHTHTHTHTNGSWSEKMIHTQTYHFTDSYCSYWFIYAVKFRICRLIHPVYQ